MAFCSECGKKVGKTENFCGHCGTKLKESIGNKYESTNKGISYKGIVLLVIFLTIFGYVLLDIWAATQVRPEVSLNSVLTTVSNMKGDVGITSASGSTKFRLKNPTFVPVILFPIKYKLSYGTTDIAEGNTDIIFIAPYDSNDISANIELSYLGGGKAVIEGIWNSITNNKEELHLDFYELGIKFASVGRKI